jgi:hypothetical protein
MGTNYDLFGTNMLNNPMLNTTVPGDIARPQPNAQASIAPPPALARPPAPTPMPAPSNLAQIEAEDQKLLQAGYTPEQIQGLMAGPMRDEALAKVTQQELAPPFEPPPEKAPLQQAMDSSPEGMKQAGLAAEAPLKQEMEEFKQEENQMKQGLEARKQYKEALQEQLKQAKGMQKMADAYKQMAPSDNQIWGNAAHQTLGGIFPQFAQSAAVGNARLQTPQAHAQQAMNMQGAAMKPQLAAAQGMYKMQQDAEQVRRDELKAELARQQWLEGERNKLMRAEIAAAGGTGKAAEKERNIDRRKFLSMTPNYKKNISAQASQIGTLFRDIDKKLDFNLDSLQYNPKTGKGTILNKQGKRIAVPDIPGVSVIGVGRQYYGERAQDLKSSLDAVFNRELKDRSGAAVTSSELEKLKTEFASGKYASEASMLDAFKRYKDLVHKKLKSQEIGEMENYLKDDPTHANVDVHMGKAKSEKAKMLMKLLKKQAK